MFGYRVPAPNEAMLISGGKTDGAPFRVITGHGAFVLPIFRKAEFLTLSMFEAEVSEPCVTRQGIALNVTAVIAAKVGNDAESIVNAGQRFLDDQNQMSVLTGRIFAGHLRSIIGSMTVEEIITERQKLATEVLEGSKQEMARMGLIVDALQIQSIDDMKLGYIAAMAAPHNAQIQQMAKIAEAAAGQAAQEAEQAAQRKQAEFVRQTTVAQAQFAAEVKAAQAEADRKAAEAEQESNRQQADYERQTAVAKAGFQAEVQVANAKAAQTAAQATQDSERQQAEYERTTSVAKAGFAAETQAAQAKAGQAGPLAAAQAQKDVTDAQAALAQRQAELRREQLVGEVVKPAEAEAERIRILAKADAEKTEIQAAAAASNNRVSLDQMLIQQLPLIVEKAAAGLSSANVTVLNGSDGLSEIVSGLVGQGLAIFESVRGNVAPAAKERSEDDREPKAPQLPSGKQRSTGD
jgi:flotillin